MVDQSEASATMTAPGIDEPLPPAPEPGPHEDPQARREATPDSAAAQPAEPQPEGPQGEPDGAPEADPGGGPGGEPDAAAAQDPQGADSAEGEDPETAGPGPGEKLDDEELTRGVAALIFASPEPLPLRRLVQLLERPRAARVRQALETLAERLDSAELPLELREIAGGWRFMTAPEVSEIVVRLSKAQRTERLSAAGLETLSVIAYRQPVTKADIEAIRGVQCGAMLRGLVDRGLVRVVGRASVPGNPLEYGTTRDFLDRFGLASLGDLPRDGELLGD